MHHRYRVGTKRYAFFPAEFRMGTVRRRKLVLIQLSFANPVKEKSGEVLIPTIILAARCLLKLVGMALV
jgi:hypothetical protein